LRCFGRLTFTVLAFFSPVLPSARAQTEQVVARAPAELFQRSFTPFVLDRTLKTPVQPIRGLAFGGALPAMAALGGDSSVRIWNATTGDVLKTVKLASRPKSASCMAVSPDGKWLVTGESFAIAPIFTAKIELLDLASGGRIRTLATHHWEVESVAFDRDGRWLVFSSWDRKIRLLEFPSGNQAGEFESASKPLCAAISPDAKVIASGGVGSGVTLWNRANDHAPRVLVGHTGAVLSVAFSPDSGRLASASADGSARIWDVRTGQSLVTLSGHEGAVTSVVFSPDGGEVASGGADHTLRLWDTTTGQDIETLGAHSAVWQVALSADGKYLAAGYADGAINVWKKQE
jgi:WD40 repeat protein